MGIHGSKREAWRNDLRPNWRREIHGIREAASLASVQTSATRQPSQTSFNTAASPSRWTRFN